MVHCFFWSLLSLRTPAFCGCQVKRLAGYIRIDAFDVAPNTASVGKARRRFGRSGHNGLLSVALETVSCCIHSRRSSASRHRLARNYRLMT